MDIIESNIDDILDTKALKTNFITNKPYSPSYIELAAKWSKLPMYKDKKSVKNFFKLLNECSVILLISGTGSGKTVLVPKFFYKYVITMGISGKIAITNPKQLTTTYNAEYGAKTLDIELGEEIGYKYKGAPANSIGEKSRLIYCTDGLIVAMILGGDKLLKDYAGIIIDEAHERHIQIDLLLKLIKDIIIERPTFKLIIMSATINATIFRDYFNVKNIKYGEMEVSGEPNYPIKQNWLDPKIKISRSNYTEIAVSKCMHILDTSDSGDILVFVATPNDAKMGCMMIKQKCPTILIKNPKICDNVYCVEVYSKMKQSDRELAVSSTLYKTTPEKYERKIIFATNVAESSITFDGLVYVVDTGFELSNYYNYIDNSYVITKQLTSQAQIKQRIGRAGRTQPGVSYHIYSEQTYNKLNLYPNPNITVIDLTEYILSFIKYSRTLKNMIGLVNNLITVPKVDHLYNSIYKLHMINAIKLIKSVDFEKNADSSSDDKLLLKPSDIKWENIKSYSDINKLINGTTTTIGYSLLKFRSSPILSALAIIMAYYMECQNEIIKIMAIIEITNGKINDLLFYSRKDLPKVIEYFEPLIYEGSDHITAYNIYNELYLKSETKYLNVKLFKTIDNRIEQLMNYATSIKEKKYEYMKEKYNIINHKLYSEKLDNMLYVLGMSHFFNIIKKESKTNYKSINFLKNSVAPVEFCPIMPTDITYNDYAICHSLVNAFGNKSFICITQIPKNIMSDILKNK